MPVYLENVAQQPLNGVNLNDYSGNSEVLLLEAKDFNPLNYRMSYFYTNFPIFISFTIFFMIYKLGLEKFYFNKIIYLLVIISLAIGLLASGNKTTMLTTIIVFLTSIYTL